MKRNNKKKGEEIRSLAFNLSSSRIRFPPINKFPGNRAIRGMSISTPARPGPTWPQTWRDPGTRGTGTRSFGSTAGTDSIIHHTISYLMTLENHGASYHAGLRPIDNVHLVTLILFVASTETWVNVFLSKSNYLVSFRDLLRMGPYFVRNFYSSFKSRKCMDCMFFCIFFSCSV